MCEYCEEEKELSHKKTGALIVIDNYTKAIDIDSYFLNDNIPINYCPMCGKKITK